MTVDMEFGDAKKASFKPDARRVVHTSPARQFGSSGVRVVNLSGSTLRKREELSGLRMKVTTLQADLDAAKNALAIANSEIVRMREEVDDLTRKNASLQDDAVRANALMDSKQSDIAALECEIEKLKEENKQLVARIDGLKGKKKKGKYGDPDIRISVNPAQPAVSEAEDDGSGTGA